MTALNIARYRLFNQHIAGTGFKNPADVVNWLGAVQAQDYLGALWAVGLRMQRGSEAAIERAIAARTIVRTWPMRGTLHLVPAADVRWMLELLTPRVVAGNLRRLEKNYELGIDDFARSRKVFVRVLQGGKALPRRSMYAALEAAHISTRSGRGLQIIWRLAQEGLICFGPREGKQHTLVLLDEWVRRSRKLVRAEALAELACRYFQSHGPATLQDFGWWSGLAPTDANSALEMAKQHLVREKVGSESYWLASRTSKRNDAAPGVYLIPPFDEYTVGYKERRAVLHPLDAKRVGALGGIGRPAIIVGGNVAGFWNRTLKKGGVLVAAQPFGVLRKIEKEALARTARRYAEFLDLSVELGKIGR